MEIFKDWLRDQGIRFEEIGMGIGFKYQGGGFIIPHHKNDKQFCQILMPNIYEVDFLNKAKTFEAINKLNVETKCLKAIIVKDSSVWLCVEMFMDSTPDLGDFMNRYLDLLLQSRMEFYSLVRE